MNDTAVDPVFGNLSWNGFQHEGWAATFVNKEFLAWGAAIRAALPDDDDTNDAEDDSPWMKATGYDPSLDPDPLRKSGRLKVVVRNDRDTRPTNAQRAAWRAFRTAGKRTADRIAAALLAVYRRQRPHRLRWWKAAYGDSPRKTLPVVKTTQAVRDIVQVKEFRVYPEQNGAATVAVILEALWCDKDIKVSVRGGQVIEVNPVERREDSPLGDYEEIDSPAFGPLRRRLNGSGWSGVFHSDHLRGWDAASKMRYRFKRDRDLYASLPVRPGPPWETVTGDFDLAVGAEAGQPPSPAQEAAFASFNKNPKATAQVVLLAILDWYRDIRPRWLTVMNGPRERTNSIMPNVRTPEGLLEIIELQSVIVMQEPPAAETTGPRVITNPFTRKKTKLPPKKPGVPIILNFHWEDEHGLGVRWRNGKVESVGDWESAINE